MSSGNIILYHETVRHMAGESEEYVEIKLEGSSVWFYEKVLNKKAMTTRLQTGAAGYSIVRRLDKYGALPEYEDSSGQVRPTFLHGSLTDVLRTCPRKWLSPIMSRAISAMAFRHDAQHETVAAVLTEAKHLEQLARAVQA